MFHKNTVFKLEKQKTIDYLQNQSLCQLMTSFHLAKNILQFCRKSRDRHFSWSENSKKNHRIFTDSHICFLQMWYFWKHQLIKFPKALTCIRASVNPIFIASSSLQNKKNVLIRYTKPFYTNYSCRHEYMLNIIFIYWNMFCGSMLWITWPHCWALLTWLL